MPSGNVAILIIASLFNVEVMVKLNIVSWKRIGSEGEEEQTVRTKGDQVDPQQKGRQKSGFVG